MRQKMEKYQVSKEKLYAALQERGLNASEASEQMGYERGYLTCVAKAHEIPKRGAIILERFYGIKPEDYQPDLLDMVINAETPETFAEKPETPEGKIPSAIIKTAAETFARVLVEQYRDTYRETLKEAILDALKESNA